MLGKIAYFATILYMVKKRKEEKKKLIWFSFVQSLLKIIGEYLCKINYIFNNKL